MFAMGSLSDLPFLKYDYGYRKDQWEWRIRDLSYAKRWLFSYFGRDPQPSDEELIRVNEAILRAFLQLARRTRHRSDHRVLSGWGDHATHARRRTGGAGHSGTLGLGCADRGYHAVCAGGRLPDAYVRDDPHYSPRGNAAVAKCIGKALEPILEELKAKTGSRSEFRLSPYLAAAPE